MDATAVTALGQTASVFLLPFLPGLLQKASESAAGEVGKRFTGAAWERAKMLWDQLGPRFAAKPEAQIAAEDAAAEPDNPDVQATFRRQLWKLLNEDPALAEHVGRQLDEANAAGIIVTSIGERSVAVGGSNTGTITTGDVESAPSPK